MNQKEHLHHLLFLCPLYDTVRQPVLSKLFLANRNLTQIIDNNIMKTMLILDPLTNLLPEAVTGSWNLSTYDVHKLSREMCYNIHKKGESYTRKKTINDERKRKTID